MAENTKIRYCKELNEVQKKAFNKTHELLVGMSYEQAKKILFALLDAIEHSSKVTDALPKENN